MPTEKKKIIYFITKSHWGGAAKYIIDLASGLDRQTFDIYIAAGLSEKPTKKGASTEISNSKKETLQTKASAADITFVEIPSFSRHISFLAEIASFFQVPKILFKIHPDIIHVNSSKAGGICGLAGFLYKFSGRKLNMIFTVHGWAFHESRPRSAIFIIKFLSRLTSFFYNAIICVSKTDYNSGVKITNPKKVLMIHNGIDKNAYDFYSKSIARSKIGIKDKSLVVGTLGEWALNKGWDILTEAITPLFEKYPNLVLVLVAGGEGPHKSELMSLIKHRSNEDKIKIIEKLSHAANYLNAFDIFTLPSRKEGLPYSILEAGLAELPVIASDIGGIPDIIENEKSGLLVRAESPALLKNSIERLIKSEKLRSEVGSCLRTEIETKFSLKKMREETYMLYEVKT